MTRISSSFGHGAAVAVSVLALGVMLPSSAEAYVDPGTGSMMLQMLGAGLAGALFFFRDLRLRVLHWLKGERSPQAGTEAATHEDPRP